MNNIVVAKDESYDEYKKLLIRKDTVSKDASQCRIAYLKRFGDLIIKSLEMKTKCIEKKKIIAYCQKIINLGGTLNQVEIDRYIDEVMEDYYTKLKKILNEKRSLDYLKPIPESSVRMVKKIYLEIAKKIHPDMNPKLKDNQKVMELWNRAVIAYECNDLNEIKEIRDMVLAYLESIGYEGNDVVIENIEEKIEKLKKEIDRICGSDPYQYKYFLEDDVLCREKEDDLNDEIKEYEEYIAELEKIIADFEVEKVYA